MYFTETDHLGSIIELLRTDGTVQEQYSYDPWGRRRNPTDWSYNNVSTTFLIDRGFTGHEHLDKFGLINMNGRIYDPVLGRFLSVDPVIASPLFTQSYNGYSYCVNNPLSYTDPSGYYPLPKPEEEEDQSYQSCMNPGEDPWLNPYRPGSVQDEMFRNNPELLYDMRLILLENNKKQRGEQLKKFLEDFLAEIAGIALVELPKKANFLGPQYSTILITKNGTCISVGSRVVYNRLLSTGRYSKPLAQSVKDFIVQNGKTLEIIGQTSKVVPFFVTGYQVSADIMNHNFTAKSAGNITGLLLGYAIGGPAGVAGGFVFGTSIEGGYDGLKFFHDGIYNIMHNISNPANWFK